MLYYVLGSPPPLWVQGTREQGGVRGSKRGARGSERGVRGSEAYVILGFRVPTTCDKKNFNDHI